MRSRKNFWGTMVIAFLWGVFFLIIEGMRYTSSGPVLALGGLVVVVFLTYQLLRLLEYVPEVMEKQPSKADTHRSRVENWLNSLDDRELEALRERLHDDEPVNTLEDLLADDYPKRKNR
jgi:cell division protein FtsW (lipid II flippase)